MKYLILILYVCYQISFSEASSGDRSPYYQACIKQCTNHNCTKDGNFTPEAALKQELLPWLFHWTCYEECRYMCMWKTLDIFEEQRLPFPKFHGKWPFQRMMGLQEPASAVASSLNMFGHYVMYTELALLKLPIRVPLYRYWKFFSFVCIHTWLWSTIFHAHDTPFTEFMDYSCAFSMIIALFISAIFRVLYRYPSAACLLVLPVLGYLSEHVRYLYSGAVDYNYNMMANVAVGTCASVIWLLWSLREVLMGKTYAVNMVVFTLWSGAALSLELLDFPPLLGWDAHALFHLATAPLPLIFYRFVIEDLKYLAGVDLDKDKYY